MTGVVDVQDVLVIGAGTMGQGIAQVAARAGYVTRLFDLAPGSAERALSKIADSLQRAVEKGKLTADERTQALSLLAPTADLDSAAARADLIIEAVPEDLALKRELFARLSKIAKPEAILATNTSSLSVTAIASAAKSPERVIGLHFFNPVPAMKLLEIVQGERTAPCVVAAARAIGARLGKEVVLVRDAPGFATSRLGIALALEAHVIGELERAHRMPVAKLDGAIDLFRARDALLGERGRGVDRALEVLERPRRLAVEHRQHGAQRDAGAERRAHARARRDVHPVGHPVMEPFRQRDRERDLGDAHGAT